MRGPTRTLVDGGPELAEQVAHQALGAGQRGRVGAAGGVARPPAVGRRRPQAAHRSSWAWKGSLQEGQR